MNFANIKYLPYVITAIFLLIVGIFVYEKKFYRFVKDYWFYSRSKTSLISTFFYILFMSLLIVALLDLRGPEQKIKGMVPEQKTIILIDTSASMLAEDIRPNRFKKAIFLARHFIKSSVGSKVSICLFSDKLVKIVPFTNDIDLLDARLGGLENVNVGNGGSNLTLAIQESLRYFVPSEKEMDSGGNLLVITDSEETYQGIDVEVGPLVSVALVGVGTAAGAPIPLRDKSGSFQKYKEFNGEQVITKLDENKIKQIGNKIKNFKFWILNSYTLPTHEIIDFFHNRSDIKFSEGDVTVRPVYSEYIIVSAIAFLILSVLFKYFKTFVKVGVVFAFIQGSYANVSAQEKIYLEKYKDGSIVKDQKLKLAELLLRHEDTKSAILLYSENLDISKLSDDELLSYANYTTALLKEKKYDEAITKLSYLQSNLPETKNGKLVKEIVRKNILFALNEKDKEKDKNKGDKKEENQKEKEEGKKDNKKEQDKGENKDEDKKDKDDGKGEDKKDSKNQNEKPDKPENKSASSGGQGSNNSQDREYMKRKIPTILKQIMQDDRKLQEQLIDKTTTRNQVDKQRDW